MMSMSAAFKCTPAFLCLALLLIWQAPRCHAFHVVHHHHHLTRQQPGQYSGLLPKRGASHLHPPPPTTTHLASAAAAASSTDADVHAATLPTEQVLAYLRQGHTVTRQFIPTNEIASVWKPQIMAAFEQERCETLRHEVHVFFGEEAYQACTTTESCLAQLKKKDANAITPFLQVFNLWRRHREIKELVFNKVRVFVRCWEDWVLERVNELWN